MHAKKKAALLVLSMAAAGCASEPPEWITRPTVEGGFAATGCVKDSGNLGLDRQIAVAKARAEVTRQIEQRVAAMDRAYGQAAEAGAPSAADESAGAGAQTSFGGVARQVAEQTLAGLPPARVEYVDLDDTRDLCAEASLDAAQARQLYDQVVRESGRPVSAQQNEALYREFSGAADSTPR